MRSFTADEQDWFAERGWYRPKNCKECAAAKKDRFQAKDEKKRRQTRQAGVLQLRPGGSPREPLPSAERLRLGVLHVRQRGSSQPLLPPLSNRPRSRRVTAAAST